MVSRDNSLVKEEEGDKAQLGLGSDRTQGLSTRRARSSRQKQQVGAAVEQQRQEEEEGERAAVEDVREVERRRRVTEKRTVEVSTQPTALSDVG